MSNDPLAQVAAEVGTAMLNVSLLPADATAQDAARFIPEDFAGKVERVVEALEEAGVHNLEAVEAMQWTADALRDGALSEAGPVRIRAPRFEGTPRFIAERYGALRDALWRLTQQQDEGKRWSKPYSKKQLAAALGVESTRTLTKHHGAHMRQVSRQAWQFDLSKLPEGVELPK